MSRILPLLLPVSCLLLVMTLAQGQAVPATDTSSAAPIPSEGLPAETEGAWRSAANADASRPDREAAADPLLAPSVLLTVYCGLIVAASLFGGWLPSLMKLTHTRMQTIVSFVGGLMLGIGVFHLIPHAAHELGSMDRVMQWLMAGILLMFFLIRTFHFHNHGIGEDPDESCQPCGHDHAHSHDHHHSHPQAHQLSWTGIVAGLSIHTLLDGVLLGTAVNADSMSSTWLPGVAVFLAIVLHKPLDAVSITSLMAASGWSMRHVQLVNAGFAMMCPLGAILFLLGINGFPGVQQELAGSALAFSAGVFLCISLSDLLPEMEFHSHHRLRLSAALVAGILVAWVIRFMEPGHFHG